MQPNDYTSAFANIPSPNDSFMKGVQNGAALQQLQAQRQQQAAAQQQAQQMNSDLAALSQNPTSEAIGKMSIKYPHLSEQFKRSFDILDPVQKQARLSQAGQVYAALHSGAPDVAQRLLKEQAAAARNSGLEQEAKEAETMASLIEAHPEFAKTSAGLMISAAMGPEKFAATFKTLGEEGRAEELRGAALSKAESDAVTAGVNASVAQGTAGDKVKQEAEAVTTAQDKRRIDQLNVEIAQADSETKRGNLILERDKLIASQATQGIEKGEGAQAQIDSSQHALNTIASLRADPMMKETAGNWVAGMGTVLGKILGAVPGTENKDFRGQLESLKSQVFLPAVQQVKGMGALSNAEGEKLTAAVAALDADMSPKAFQNALGVVDRYMTKGLQKGLASKAVPVQGGGLVVNHPTFGPVREGDINRLMKQFPGSTREQVVEFLNRTQPGAK